MATVYKWTPFDVALDITATGSNVVRKSASQFTVKINASWETYYSGAKTNYGMTASSGGGSATINTFGVKASSGSGSFTGTYSISGNGASSKTITVTFRNFNSDNGNSATKNVSFSVSVPAWTSYTIVYNANGGSGAPGNQTKTYGKTLTLSTTKPTRTNYNFKGWGTSASATTVTYSPGGSYTANASATLYAIWTLAYLKPRITDLSVTRCDSNGIATDEGQNGLVSFKWACDKTVTSIVVKWKLSSSSTWTSSSVSATGTSGTVSKVIGNNALSIENTYDIHITVADDSGSSYVITNLTSMKFSIDIKAGGTGIAFGKAAETDNVADIAYQAKFSGGILQPILATGTDLNTVLTPNVYSGRNITDNPYANAPFPKGSFTLRVEAAGPNGQIKQTITVCDKNSSRIWERFYYTSAWGDWKAVYSMPGTVLWSGGYYMTSGHTINLSEKISVQPNGICLVFSEYYDGAIKNQTFCSFFVSKNVVASHEGSGHCFKMSTSNLAYYATKYLYISDAKIVGHDNNNLTGTGTCGIKYTNNRFVLRYVIGV